MSDLPKARVVRIGNTADVDSKFDDHKPVTRDEVSDENPKVLAHHIRNLQAEMRTGFELLNQRLLPLLERLESKLDDVTVRVNRLERDRDDHDKRLRALEAQATHRPKRARK